MILVNTIGIGLLASLPLCDLYGRVYDASISANRKYLTVLAMRMQNIVACIFIPYAMEILLKSYSLSLPQLTTAIVTVIAIYAYKVPSNARNSLSDKVLFVATKILCFSSHLFLAWIAPATSFPHLICATAYLIPLIKIAVAPQDIFV